MKKIKYFLIIFVLFSCKKENIKYQGFEDLVIGSYSLNFYDNNTFEIELGLGYEKGTYWLKGDTIYLKYEKPSKLPQIILMNENYFNTVPDKNNKSEIIINRVK